MIEQVCSVFHAVDGLDCPDMALKQQLIQIYMTTLSDLFSKLISCTEPEAILDDGVHAGTPSTQGARKAPDQDILPSQAAQCHP